MMPLLPVSKKTWGFQALGCDTRLDLHAYSAAGPRVVVPALDLKRLAEAEAMLARFSRENEWLALQVRIRLA